MNAVKRCQALIAATLLIGACGGDPTAPDAGKGLSIRATPGAVWVRNHPAIPVSSAQVKIEAVDKLGGPVQGSWTVGTITGPFTVVLDTTFQNTTAGALGVMSRFVITPTAEGEGSVVFTGTGGSVTVPVRVAPDTSAFNVVFSSLNPAIGASFTATAPAGTRFTSSTTINFYNGPLPLNINNGLAAPAITGYNADSTVMTILPAPGASGQIRFTGIANVSTPGLTTNARSTGSVTVPVLSSVAAVISNAAPAVNTSITITMPAQFKFRPTSQLTRAGAGEDPMQWFVLSRSADSNSVVVFPGPGGVTPVTIGAVQFAPLASLSLGLPTSNNITFALQNMGTDDANVSTVTIGQMTAPSAVGGVAVYYDTASYLGPDHVGDGGVAKEIDYKLTVPVAGTYNIKMRFTGATTDNDLFLTSAAPVTGANSGDIGFSFLGNGAEETITFTATAGQTIIVSSNWFAGPAVKMLRYVITRTA